MSYEAMHKVRASGLTDRTQVDVLESLAFFHNQATGACFPSTESIAKVARLSPNIARRAIKELEEGGYISTHQKPGGKRHFILFLDRLPVGSLDGEGVSQKGEVSVQKGVTEVEGVSEVKPLPCQKCASSPVRSDSYPLSDLTPEQGINKVLNKEEVTRNIGAPASDHFRDVTKKVETPKKEKRPNRWVLVDRPEGVSPEAWKNFCQIRAVKRIPLTETAWKGIEKEAAKAGLSLSETIDICNEHGWAGFKNSWLQNTNRSTGSTTVRHTDPQYGIGVCQPPKEPTRMFTPEEAEETRRQMLEEGLIF